MNRLGFLATLMLMALQACTISAISSSSDSSPQNRLEPFDRGADYDYGFSSLEGASSYYLALSQEGFNWPALVTDADSAFGDSHSGHRFAESSYFS